jgi:hypothetical protein
MNRTAVFATTALGLALSACGGGTADDEPATANGDRPGLGAEVAGTTAAQSPAGGVRAASCTDAPGDGGPADITAVKLVEGGEGLRATFTLAAPLDTSTGTALLSLMVSSQDGETARQLGAKWIDGQAQVFVFDSGTAQNEYVDVPPVVDGNTIHVTFPRSAIVGLGGTWRWGATTSVDGTDVDDCPEPGDDVLNPPRQTFPG